MSYVAKSNSINVKASCYCFTQSRSVARLSLYPSELRKTIISYGVSPGISRERHKEIAINVQHTYNR